MNTGMTVWRSLRKEIHRLTRKTHTPLVTREGPLCQRCSDLDFQALFGSDLLPEFGGHYFDFVFDVAASSLTCPLCSLLRHLILGHYDSFDLFRDHSSLTEEVSMSIRTPPSCETKVQCRRFLVSESHRRFSLCDWPKDPKRVDLGPLKQKLAECKAKHGQTCCANNRILVEGLQVYNCLTNKVEKATIDTKYVALSYVWGSDQGSSSRKPPEQCRTISDAMQVALRLGYKYIWIDQLCISQDGTHKLQQIKKMNRIYQNADLTIVAAAGDNSDHGIPGVRDRSRLARTCFKIGDLQFVETMPDPWELIYWTTYRSRAWIFQEEKLSHRLLVFTERAAWFSCYLTSANEGFETRPRENEEESSSEIDSKLAKKSPRPPCGLKVPLRFDLLIAEYSNKLLTYPSDAVNAFSGILAALEEAKLIVSHVWGTPIMPPIALLNSHNMWDPGSGVVDLERNTVDGFIVGLMWETREPEVFQRRHGIPSWSWAGWQGYVTFAKIHQEENVNLGIEVFIECTDGQVLTWSEFEGLSYLENQPNLISRFIRLKAWTMDVRLEYHEPSRYAVVRMLNGDEIRSEAILLGEPLDASNREQLDEFKYGEYTGVCLFPIDRFSKSSRYVMLLHKVNGNFQRIGFFMLGMFFSEKMMTASGEVTYYDWKDNGETSKLDMNNYRALGLNARMEEIRID